MMGSDARDMMGLPSAGPTPKPTLPKAPKPKIKGGMAREVLDLNFEGAPPISIVAPKFKEKPKIPFKPRRWEQTPFMNSARKDGLVLRHWKREGDAAPNVAGLPVTPADSNAASEMDTDDRPAANIEDSRAAKWNVKLDRPRYSAEEYDTHLKNGDWSKEETDYLVDLVIDYDLRWVVIDDRYDFRPQPKPSEHSEDAMAIDAPAPQPRPRTMEDLKSRYYGVAAKCMALRTPLSSMNPTEFEEHEKMMKFDPKKETLRKQYVEKLFLRTPEEAHEEELLLKELSRIVLNQEKLFEDRKALYDRLEAPRAINPAAAHASTTVYQSSQGLQQLMQTMMQSQRLRDAEKREKRRSALGVDTETANSHTAADLRTGGGGTGGGRSSIGSASAGGAGGHEKRQPHPTPQHRHFSQAERIRFGIAYPQERLTSGVQFRHERVVKASQAKSAVQTTRINDALAELGIPSRLMMPTNRVVTEYERLVEGVKQLVEIRKMREKVDGEIKIWEAQRRLANGDGADEVDAHTAGENGATNAQSEQPNDEGADKEAEKKEGDDAGNASKVESKEDAAEEQADEPTRSNAEEKVEDEDETQHLENSRAEVEEDVKDEDEDEDGEGSNASQVIEEEEDEEDEDEDEEEEGGGDGEREDEEQSDDDDDDDDEGENEDERAEVGKDAHAVNSSENQVDDSNENGENEDHEAGATEANEPDDGSSTRARKRSASVISAVSNKSSKRQKK